MTSLMLGITPFAMQPIRAAHFPALNEGEPTACRTELTFSCTFSAGTKDAFMYNFNRGQYGKPDLGERQAPFTGQLDMWWFYFKWQWLRDAHMDHQLIQKLLGALFLVLGLLGGYVHWQRDRRSFWYFGSLMFTMTLVLIYYLNFKYGASQAPELTGVAREVRDRDYFYLWSFSAWGVWASLGLIAAWESLAALFDRERVVVGRELLLGVFDGIEAATTFSIDATAHCSRASSEAWIRLGCPGAPMSEPKKIHAWARFIRSGSRLIYASIPRRSSSWPLNATKKQSRAGSPAAATRIASSQQASRLPCSLTHCHHALRGAIRTRGASVGLLPLILTVTLKACAVVRRT